MGHFGDGLPRQSTALVLNTFSEDEETDPEPLRPSVILTPLYKQ